MEGKMKALRSNFIQSVNPVVFVLGVAILVTSIATDILLVHILGFLAFVDVFILEREIVVNPFAEEDRCKFLFLAGVFFVIGIWYGLWIRAVDSYLRLFD